LAASRTNVCIDEKIDHFLPTNSHPQSMRFSDGALSVTADVCEDQRIERGVVRGVTQGPKGSMASFFLEKKSPREFYGDRWSLHKRPGRGWCFRQHILLLCYLHTQVHITQAERPPGSWASGSVHVCCAFLSIAFQSPHGATRRTIPRESQPWRFPS